MSITINCLYETQQRSSRTSCILASGLLLTNSFVTSYTHKRLVPHKGRGIMTVAVLTGAGGYIGTHIVSATSLPATPLAPYLHMPDCMHASATTCADVGHVHPPRLSNLPNSSCVQAKALLESGYTVRSASTLLP